MSLDFQQPRRMNN